MLRSGGAETAISILATYSPRQVGARRDGSSCLLTVKLTGRILIPEGEHYADSNAIRLAWRTVSGPMVNPPAHGATRPSLKAACGAELKVAGQLAEPLRRGAPIAVLRFVRYGVAFLR